MSTKAELKSALRIVISNDKGRDSNDILALAYVLDDILDRLPDDGPARDSSFDDEQLFEEESK